MSEDGKRESKRESDKRAAWEQLPGESDRWYERFTLYRMMGPERTIEQAAKRNETQRTLGAAVSNRKLPKRPSRHWYYAAKRFDWTQRAAAWDAMRRDEDEATARRSLVRVKDDLWEIYEAGLVKLRQGLAMPLVRSRTTREELLKDGRTVRQEITVEPMPGVNMSALASFMSQVVRAAQLVGGIDDVEKLSNVTPEKIATMSDEELHELHDLLAPVVERGTQRHGTN